ncbi:MAG: hypothetical protein K8J31_25230 [Anaerolineae bacterium]|nr:hypothetical protein [Anaerolineae bacterium]
MIGFIDVSAILLGLVFGIVLSASIVMFLIHATIHTPQSDEDSSRFARFGAWKPISKYEGRRTYLYVAGHDPDFEW